MKTGIELIAEERQRQTSKEGWTPEHDDQHDNMQLGEAATCYALCYMEGHETTQGEKNEVPPRWPWADEWWKPSDPIRNLVKAGALIAAEIDRLQRLAVK
jgi:hypothetical protein